MFIQQSFQFCLKKLDFYLFEAFEAALKYLALGKPQILVNIGQSEDKQRQLCCKIAFGPQGG